MDPEKIRHRLFRSLKDAAQLLELFDYVPNVYLYVKDREGRFVAINRQQVQMKGLADQSEIWGKTDLDLHPAYWGQQYQEEDRRVMDGRQPIPNQVWLVPTRGGRLGTFVSSKIPLRGMDDEIIGVAGVMYRIDRSGQATANEDPVDRATDYVAARYDQTINVESMAAHVGLSTSQLNRRFKAKFQMTPSEYLRRVRVYQASRCLIESDLSITEVAMRCGFFDSAHLTRTFRRGMGQTPKEFRQQNRDGDHAVGFE